MLPTTDADDRGGGQPPGLGRRVDLQVDRDQRASLAVEPAEQRGQFGDLRREIAQARDHEHVGLFGGDLLERPDQRRPLIAAADAIDVVDDLGQLQAALPAAARRSPRSARPGPRYPRPSRIRNRSLAIAAVPRPPGAWPRSVRRRLRLARPGGRNAPATQPTPGRRRRTARRSRAAHQIRTRVLRQPATQRRVQSPASALVGSWEPTDVHPLRLPPTPAV